MSKLLRYSGPFTDKTEVFDELEKNKGSLIAARLVIERQRKGLIDQKQEIKYLQNKIEELTDHDTRLAHMTRSVEAYCDLINIRSDTVIQGSLYLPRKDFFMTREKTSIWLDKAKRLSKEISDRLADKMVKEIITLFKREGLL